MIIREARIDDAAGIAKVHVDTWRTTYAGILPDEHLANLSYERREKLWIDYILSDAESRIFNYVAENDAGQIVGFASGGPGGVMMDEVAYGWTDINTLLQDRHL